MKKISLIVVFILAVFVSKSQTKSYDTIPYVPEFYAKRVALFNNESIVSGKVIFLGNSITQFGDWKKLLKDSFVINRGIAGDITFGVLNRLDDVIARQPSRLFVKIGINDIAKDIPEEVIVANIVTIVQKVKAGSPKTQIFVHSILPTNDSVKNEYPNAYNKNGQVVKVNRQLKSNATKFGYTYIDLYKTFSDKKGKLSVKYAEADGLHLNKAGYLKWVEVLKKKRYL